MIRIGVRSFVAGGGPSNDADAQAFIDAAGITDATQQSAINTLVLDLKGYSIWAKMKAIYPFCGGTASTHKWNLKDARDLDAAFRLVFSGGSTHSSTGWLPNGTNGYADTKLNENNIMTLNNEHVSFYSRTNNNTNSADISAVAFGTETNIYPNFGGNIYGRVQGTSGIANSNNDTRGFFMANRINNTQVFVYKNSIKYTVSSNSVSKSNNNFTLGAVITTPSNNYSNRQLAFASIGDGLTDTEAANLYTAVQAYQTTLSRNV
jgi:hypothetical protein